MNQSPHEQVATARHHPRQPFSNGACQLALVIAMISWFALVVQTDFTLSHLMLRGLSLQAALERLCSYLTNLTILLSAICFTALAWRTPNQINLFFYKPHVITAIVAYQLFVGIAYNLLLRHLWHPSGVLGLANESLHTIVPLLSMVYWIVFTPQFEPRLKQSFLWLIYPTAYLAVILWRGSNTGFYPYPFINVRDLGYPHALWNALLLFVGFMVQLGLLICINRAGKALRLRR